MQRKKINVQHRAKILLRIFAKSWQLRPGAVLLYLFGALLETSSSITAIYAGARLSGILAHFVTSGQSDGVWFWFWITTITGALMGLGFLAMAYSKRILYYSITNWSINTFLLTLTEINFPEFYNDETRNLIQKVGGSYSWQMSNLMQLTFDLLYGILRFIAITIVVAQISWWVVPIIALFLVPTLLSDAKVSKLQWFVWDQKGDERHIFWGLEYLLRQAKSQMELRSLQASKHVLNKIDSMNSKFYNEQEVLYKKARPTLISAQILEGIGPAIAGIVVLRQFLHKIISFEQYLFTTGALVRIGGALNNIFGTLTTMQEPLILAENYFMLIEQVPKIKDAPDSKKLSTSTTPEIIFEDVTFTYPNQMDPVFKKFNLTIAPGEHIALVGENGAGKSTLIKLLLRFYKPDSGRILVNGQDLSLTTIDSWYEQIATLFQDFNQYPFTVAENITIGRSSNKPSKKLLNESAKFGGVDYLVKKYKYGWETVLESSFKNGIEPSGGQWQRIAISRAFYRQANILILDEPTSAIDAKAEYEIFNNIFDHYKNKSALIVSHRFSTVRRADRIVMLDQGEIVQEGSHQELMKKSGLYHDLFTKQAAGYKE